MDTDGAARLLDQADAAFGEQRYHDALRLSEKATRLDSESVDAWYYQGLSWLSLRDVDHAERCLRQADIMLPGQADIQGALGECLLERGRFLDAKALLTSSEKKDPDHPRASYLLGIIAEFDGDAELAKACFDRAAQLDPDAYWVPVQLEQETFEAGLQEALDELPEEVSKAIANVPVRLVDLPAPELFREDPEIGPTVLGYWRGASLLDKNVFDPWSQLPGEILIFQKNLERYCQSPEQLRDEIRITLLHEIGHVLGLNEQDLEDRGLD